jgi:FkbM family methyltransferase
MKTTGRKGFAFYFFERLIRSTSFKKFLSVDHSNTLNEVVFGSSTISSDVIQSKEFIEKLICDKIALSLIVQESRMVDYLFENPTLLEKLLQDERMLEVAKLQSTFLSTLFATEECRDAIMLNEDLYLPLLADNRLKEALVSRPKILSSLLEDNRTRDFLLSDSSIRKQCIDHEQLLRLIDKQPENEGASSREQGILAELSKLPLFIRSVVSYSYESISYQGRESQSQQKIPLQIEGYSVLGDFLLILSKLNDASVRNQVAESKFYQIASRFLRGTRDVQNCIMDVVAPDNRLQLGAFQVEGFDRRSIWILLNELFINQDYYFESTKKCPLIIDCGASYGLSIFYFKLLFPEAQILAFEPQIAVRDLLAKNLLDNRIENVEVLPFALMGDNGDVDFLQDESDILAGRVMDHSEENKSAVYKVEGRRLSQFIGSEVDFLKLDIEGAEDQVILEMRDKLHFVRNIFCEYHSDENESPRRLREIITLLEDAGFNVTIAKAYGSHKYTHVKPLTFVGEKSSSVIFATRASNQK